MRLVYFSPLPWSSFAQRPHRFVEWFHVRHKAEVLWVDPYPTRFPAWSDLRRLYPRPSIREPGDKAGTFRWLTVVKPIALPIEPMRVIGKLNGLMWRNVFKTVFNFLSGNCGVIGIGKPSEIALQVLQRHPGVRSFYDAMDDYPAFYDGSARRAMELRTNRIASRVSHILASSEGLFRLFERHQSKLLMVKNACDTSGLPPVSSIDRDRDRSVIGYVGTIGHWFDWPLVFALSETRPSMNIRLLGPIYAKPPAPIPSNVELLPACDHYTAMKIMQKISIGLIPFKCTDLTNTVDPIKYYEYRALGLPVISSRFGEMALRDREPGTFIVDEYSDLEPHLKHARSYRYDESEVRAFRCANSWAARFNASELF